MSGQTSRRKGKRGELAVASILRRCFPDSRRGRQFDTARECDNEGTPFRIETKTRKTISYKQIMEWLTRNAEEGKAWDDERLPILITKRDRETHLLHMFLPDFVAMVEKFFYNYTEEEESNVRQLFKDSHEDSRYK